MYGLTARPRSPINGALPAGAESSASSESGSVVELAVPELLVGYLQDLDIDPDPWDARRQPELCHRHQSERPRFRDAAVGDREVRMVDRGTDPDDAIRLDFSARIDPRTLAGMVLGSPVVPVATLAHLLAPPPVDPEDHRAVLYAVEAVATAEATLCENVLTGLHGAYWAGGLPRAIQWAQEFLGVHMARPQ